MTVEDRIARSGAPGSPYTRKMPGLLRYRRLPYRFMPPDGETLAGLPAPKVRLLPTFYLRGESGALEAVVDSTRIIRRLEGEHAERAPFPRILPQCSDSFTPFMCRSSRFLFMHRFSKPRLSPSFGSMH